MDLVHLTTCSTAIEAEIYKGRLESEGIHCEIFGADLNRMLPIGEIELRVLPNDLARAQAILEAIENEQE